MIYKFRQKEKLNECQLKAKKIENLHLKEELLKIKSGKDKLKENFENYRKENKRLKEASECFLQKKMSRKTKRSEWWRIEKSRP